MYQASVKSFINSLTSSSLNPTYKLPSNFKIALDEMRVVDDITHNKNNYAIPITSINRNEYTFYNLIISEDMRGGILESFIIEYHMTDIFKHKLKIDHGHLDQFSGEIRIRSIKSSKGSASFNKNSSCFATSICQQQYGSGNSGGGSGGSGGGPGGPSGGGPSGGGSGGGTNSGDEQDCDTVILTFCGCAPRHYGGNSMPGCDCGGRQDVYEVHIDCTEYLNGGDSCPNSSGNYPTIPPTDYDDNGDLSTVEYAQSTINELRAFGIVIHPLIESWMLNADQYNLIDQMAAILCAGGGTSNMATEIKDAFKSEYSGFENIRDLRWSLFERIYGNNLLVSESLHTSLFNEGENFDDISILQEALAQLSSNELSAVLDIIGNDVDLAIIFPTHMNIIEGNLGISDETFLNPIKDNLNIALLLASALNSSDLSHDEKATTVTSLLNTIFDNDFDNLGGTTNASPPQDVQNGISISNTIIPTSSFDPRVQNYSTAIGESPSRGNTEDLTFGTNGNDEGIIGENYSNSTLWNTMSELFNLTSIADSEMEQIGDSYINHFQSNLGTTLFSPAFSARVANHPSVKNYLKDFGKRFEDQICGTNCSPDNGFIDMGSSRPIFNTLYDLTHGFQILLNDTESTQIKMKEFDFNQTNGDWSAEIMVTINDHFGLDKNDALTYQNKHQGFASWWRLQHMKGYKPFKSKIIFFTQINGNIQD